MESSGASEAREKKGLLARFWFNSNKTGASATAGRVEAPSDRETATTDYGSALDPRPART